MNVRKSPSEQIAGLGKLFKEVLLDERIPDALPSEEQIARATGAAVEKGKAKVAAAIAAASSATSPAACPRCDGTREAVAKTPEGTSVIIACPLCTGGGR